MGKKVYHALNGTEETKATFSHSPTSQEPYSDFSTRDCYVTWRRFSFSLDLLQSPPMALVALPLPCWAGICTLFPAGKALGSRVWLLHH